MTGAFSRARGEYRYLIQLRPKQFLNGQGIGMSNAHTKSTCAYIHTYSVRARARGEGSLCTRRDDDALCAENGAKKKRARAAAFIDALKYSLSENGRLLDSVNSLRRSVSFLSFSPFLPPLPSPLSLSLSLP